MKSMAHPSFPFSGYFLLCHFYSLNLSNTLVFWLESIILFSFQSSFLTSFPLSKCCLTSCWASYYNFFSSHLLKVISRSLFANHISLLICVSFYNKGKKMHSCAGVFQRGCFLSSDALLSISRIRSSDRVQAGLCIKGAVCVFSVSFTSF